MKYFKIKEDLYLVEQEITKKENIQTSELTNQIFIYDRSGSMWADLPRLTEDLITKAREIPLGDTLTLGWFSGEGQFNFIVKGFKITESRDYKIIENAVRQNNRTIGCTCFSEILMDTKNVIKDLSIFSDKFSLFMFTDGCPVVSDYTKEITNIRKAIKDIAGKVSASCMVGYGNYYNRELMAEIAENLGGCLIHSNNLDQFNIVLSDFIKNTGNSDGKIEVELEAPSHMGITFSINGNSINIYKEEDDHKIRFVPTKEKTDRVFTLVDSVPFHESRVYLDENNILRPTMREPIIQAIYATAFVLNQKAKTDIALETLASIGEVNYIDMLNNAFTNQEHGVAEEALREAINNKKIRLAKGYNTKYLPSPNAFCLLDALEILMKDDKAFFYPQHPLFNYSRIGVATKTKGEYPKFRADLFNKCSFSNLTWNDSKLNLSVLAKLNGTIDFIGDANTVGFSQTYPTFVFRNYSLVKDGFLNMNTLPVSLSEDNFKFFKEKGMIDEGESFKEDGIYELNFKIIPIINRSISDGNISATELSKKVFEELTYKAQIKVLNDLKKELVKTEGIVDDIFKGMTEAQIEFLKKNGITKNGFSPEVEKAETTDFYYAKEFEIKVKGYSSLPKVADVKTKIASGKALRAVDLLVKSGLDLVENSPVKGLNNNIKVAWLEEEIKKIKNKMLKIRFEIQKTKFSTILCKKWFGEFTNRENCELVIDGNIFNFVLSETKVNI